MRIYPRWLLAWWSRMKCRLGRTVCWWFGHGLADIFHIRSAPHKVFGRCSRCGLILFGEGHAAEIIATQQDW